MHGVGGHCSCNAAETIAELAAGAGCTTVIRPTCVSSILTSTAPGPMLEALNSAPIRPSYAIPVVTLPESATDRLTEYDAGGCGDGGGEGLGDLGG